MEREAHINVVQRTVFNDSNNQSIWKPQETHWFLVNASRQTFCISTLFFVSRRFVVIRTASKRGTRWSIAQPEINTNLCANTYGGYFYLFIYLVEEMISRLRSSSSSSGWHRLRRIQHEWKTIIINKFDHLNFESHTRHVHELITTNEDNKNRDDSREVKQRAEMKWRRTLAFHRI